MLLNMNHEIDSKKSLTNLDYDELYFFNLNNWHS